MHIGFGKNKLFYILKKILPLIGISIFVYIIMKIGINNIATTFLKISPIHIVIVSLLVIPGILLTNYQWQLVLKKQKIKISFIKSIKILLIGGFYGVISPGKIGEWIKVYYMKEETKEPYGKLFINRFITSGLSTFAYLFFLLFSAFYFSNLIPIALPISIGLIIFSIIFLVYFIKKERGEKTLYFLIKLFIPKKSKPKFFSFVNTFYKDIPSPKYFILPFLITFPLMILTYTQVYIIALSLDVQIPYIAFIMICPIIGAISSIPISFGSLGIREISYAYFLSMYGVDLATSVVISLSAFLIFSIPSIVLGFIFSITWPYDKVSLNKFKLKIRRKPEPWTN